MKRTTIPISEHRQSHVETGEIDEPFFFRIMQAFYLVDDTGAHKYEGGLYLELSEQELREVVKLALDYLTDFYPKGFSPGGKND